MGNQLSVIQQQWTPPMKPMRDLPLDKRPFKIVVECPVNTNTGSQLVQCETQDISILDQCVLLYNNSKYSLRWQYVKELESFDPIVKDKDVIVLWVYENEHQPYGCYRIEPHSVQEIQLSGSAYLPFSSQETNFPPTRTASKKHVAVFNWVNETAAKYGHYEPMWVYETEHNSVWPVYSFLKELCFNPKMFQRGRPKGITRDKATSVSANNSFGFNPSLSFLHPADSFPQNNPFLPAQQQNSAIKFPLAVSHHATTDPPKTLVWTLVYKSKAGYDITVQKLRDKIHGAAISDQRRGRHDTSGCSGSTEEEDVSLLHKELVQYLDFDDAWIQTGALRLNPNDETCVKYLSKQLKEKFAQEKEEEEEEVTEQELVEFARRRLRKLQEEKHRFLPESFSDPMCPGLALPGTKTTSPFDCYAQVVIKHPILSDELREQALVYHYPGEKEAQEIIPCSSEKKELNEGKQWDEVKKDEPVESMDKMVLYGLQLGQRVNDYCLDNMIPKKRLHLAFKLYDKALKTKQKEDQDKIDRDALSLFFLVRAGEWLQFWGKRGYGFAPRMI